LCHAYGINSYFDTYIGKELSEFNNAYVGVRLDKVQAHITLTLKD
jgi:hypothetical protein